MRLDAAGRLVEALLRGPLVEDFMGGLHSQQRFVKRLARLSTRYTQRRVIDAHCRSSLVDTGPDSPSLAGWEIDELQRMAIGIAKLERSDCAILRRQSPCGPPCRDGFQTQRYAAARCAASMSDTTIAKC